MLSLFRLCGFNEILKNKKEYAWLTKNQKRGKLQMSLSLPLSLQEHLKDLIQSFYKMRIKIFVR